MTNEERFYILGFLIIWAIVWVCIVAVLKARQTEDEKREERFCNARGLIYISNTDFWIGLSIWWPVLLTLSPFYLLYKCVYKIAKRKEE